MRTIAIAGASHFHVEYILREIDVRSDAIKLVGVSDEMESGGQALANRMQVPFFRGATEMFDQVRPDAVAIFDRYSDRANIICAALDRGISVMSDKPVCLNSSELSSIAASMQESDAFVSTIFEKRWSGITMQARALLRAGAVGEVRLISASAPHKLNIRSRPAWFTDARYYGDILTDLPIHDIDLALLVTGARHGTVSAWRSPARYSGRPGWSDSCALKLTLEDTASACLEADWMWPSSAEHHGQYRMRIAGTTGALELDWSQDTMAITSDADWTRTVRSASTGLRPAQNVIEALIDGVSPEVAGDATIGAARVAIAAQRSADSGGQVERWSFDD